MQEVYVVDAYRTPFGSFCGELSDVPAPKLAAPVIRRLLEAHKLKGENLDQVISRAGFVRWGWTGPCTPGYAFFRHSRYCPCFDNQQGMWEWLEGPDARRGLHQAR